MNQTRVRVVHLANRHDDEPSAGHGYWLNHALKDSCEAGGIEFVIAASRHNKDSSVEKILTLSKQKRIQFTAWPYLGLSKDVQNLEQILAAAPGVESFLHIYEGGLREYLIIILLRNRNPSLRIIFNFNLADPWNISLISRGFSSKLIWRIISDCASRLAGGVLFTAETLELAQLFSTRSNFPMIEYPLPAQFSEPRVSYESKIYDFFIPVFGPEELELVCSALNDLKEKGRGKLKVIIQPKWSSSIPENTLDMLSRLGVEIAAPIISQNEYKTKLVKSRGLILPYKNLDYYKLQSSGRMVDAVANGTRVIVPEGTSLARKVQGNGWGSTFDVCSGTSLAKAMGEILEIEEPFTSHGPLLTPFYSIVGLLEQITPADSLGETMSASRMRFSRTRVLVMGLLFLTTDFRSFISGVLSFIGVSTGMQASLSRIFPRRTSPVRGPCK
jgi:hypothetical protein